MPTKLEEARDKLNGKRDELGAIFAKYPNMDIPAEVVEDIQNRNKELSDLGVEFEKAREIDEIFQANVKALKEQKTPVNGLNTPPSAGGPVPLRVLPRVAGTAQKPWRTCHRKRRVQSRGGTAPG